MNAPNDLTDDEREAMEQMWEDLDGKVLLAEILTELQQIRMSLSQADSGASDGRDEQGAYRCRKCDETVEADARERHARKAHKAPGDMVADLFEVVE